MKLLRLVASLTLTVSVGVSASMSAPNAQPGEELITAVKNMGFPGPATQPPVGGEAQGPYKKLVIQNAYIIDGAGAPVQGPVSIVIERDRIVDIVGAGTGSLAIGAVQESADTHVIDAKGKYVMPGFVNAHTHFGTPSHLFGGGMTDPEYVAKLWLAHGITTVREAGSLMGLGWTLDHKKMSEEGKIAAPRIVAHALFPEVSSDPKASRAWVRTVRKRGADGIKFLGGSPEAVAAAIDEAHKLGMKTMFHHAQVAVARMNAVDSARLGLDSMEHWYGLPEAMFENKTVQDYPLDYKYNDEQDRFAHAGRLWAQSAKPGSETWNKTIKELIDLDFTIDPTFSIYEANRDQPRAKRLEWMDEYTMPYMLRAFEPNPKVHGSYHYDWTTGDEVAWRENFRIWMQFINDFKNAGGRVTTGSDTGFIYGVYGFGYIRELELLQEAGFHPIEVVKSATLNGAQLLGMDKDIGSIQIGKKADLVIVNENPLRNFKVLYATGHEFLNRDTGKLEKTKGIEATIKDGVVYDAEMLRQQVKTLVSEQKAREAARAAAKAK